MIIMIIMILMIIIMFIIILLRMILMIMITMIIHSNKPIARTITTGMYFLYPTSFEEGCVPTMETGEDCCPRC